MDLSVCHIKRDRESESTEGVRLFLLPVPMLAWQGWWRRCLTIGVGRYPSSLYCTPYISAGISAFWCIPITISQPAGCPGGIWCPPEPISHLVGRPGGFWCPPMTISHFVDHPVVSGAHLWQYLTLLGSLVVSGPTYDANSPLVVSGAHLWQYLTLLTRLMVSGAHL